MGYFLSILIGYLVGCLSPSLFISRMKEVNIREVGSGNPGGTNTFLHIGKGWGVFVMVFDAFKAIFAVLICQSLFPEIALAGVLAGTATIMGHMFPFYHKFKGGKGLACLAGVIVITDWRLFFLALFVGIAMSLITNIGVMMAISAATVYPIAYSIELQSMPTFLILSVSSTAMIYKHLSNIRRIRAGEEKSVREVLRRKKS